MHVLKNSEVDVGSARFSRTLDRLGIDRRGSVACLLANTPEYLFAYRGATWSGRRFTPMSGRWTADEVSYVVENCEADCLIVDARYRDRISSAADHVRPNRRFSVGGSIPGFRPWSDIDLEDGSTYESPLAGSTMLYTSGTTGRPKGVLRRPVAEELPPTLTGRAGQLMMSAFLPEGARGGVHLVAAPLYHAGPNTYCDGALLLGSDVVLMESFDAEAFLAAVEEYRATSTFLVPTHFVRFLRLPKEVRSRYDLSSMQLVCHGAAPVSVPVKRAMIDWWGPVLFEFYGGTEGGGNMIDSQTWLRKPGSVGRPRPGQVLRILDDDDNEVPTGVEGMVCYELDETPFEYKDDPEKTLGSRRGGRCFTLGDVGYVDDEGYLFLCDRRADVIISGAVNIYPAQIESVLMELDFVGDCCVVGVPNEEWGEEVRAVIQLERAGSDESAARLELNADRSKEILKHCREKLSAYQVPRAIDFVDELPRTETGKLARRAIRGPYWEGHERRV
jgi:long-chain acyl-CoA synthetase